MLRICCAPSFFLLKHYQLRKWVNFQLQRYFLEISRLQGYFWKKQTVHIVRDVGIFFFEIFVSCYFVGAYWYMPQDH